MLIIVVYVDDIIFGSNDDRMSQKFAEEMQKEFEMSMLGELSFFLGLQITQTNKGIFISQTKYIKEMLKKFGMEDCKPVSTPMVTGCKLSKEDESKEANQTLYRSMIGSLCICNNFKTRYYAGSRASWKVSSNTKGNTCTSSKNNIQISERHIGLWFMVSHRKILYFDNLHRCRLGR
jgi:hypothetical protein